MSQTIKFTVSDENYQLLCSRADAERLSLQDYIRKQLLSENTIFTPLEAVNRALKKYSPEDTFSLPDIYGDEWTVPNGVAGQFGRKFFELVEAEYGSEIEFTKTYNEKKQAVYIRK